MKVSSVIESNDTIHHLDDNVDLHIDSMTKLNWHFIKYLADSLNVTLQLHFQHSWGYFDNKTKTWDGMVGDLISNISDIGGSVVIITEERSSLIDFMAMTTKTKTKFVFRASPLSQATNIYILPFHRNVWLCFAGVVVFSIFVIYCLTRYENTLQNQLSDIIFVVAGVICQMNANIDFRLSSTRIAIYYLFMTITFMVTSYSASIVALLQSTTKNFQTVNEFMLSNMNFGIQDVGYNHYYFKNSDDPRLQRFYESKIAPPGQPENYMNLSYGVSRVRQGHFAFHMELGAGYKLVDETFFDHEKCGLMEIAVLKGSEPWLPIKKNSPYKEILKTKYELV